MKDDNKTVEQLTQELAEIKYKIAKLEGLEKLSRNQHSATRNERFSKAFYCCPDIITITTLQEGRYVEVNETFLQLTGYKRSEVIGHTVHELEIWAFPEDRIHVMQLIQQSEGIRNYEMGFRNKNREVYSTLLSANKISIDGESYLLCVVKDISERKKMTEAIRLSEERFSKSFNASPITMSISTLKEGCFLDVNDSFCRVIGVRREEIIGRTSDEIGFWVNPDQRELVIQTILEKGSISDLEIKFTKLSGAEGVGYYWGEKIDINGQLCLLSLLSDLTERKQMEIEMSRLDRLNLVGEMAASIAHDIRNPMTTVRGYLQMLRNNQDFNNEIELFNLMIEELDRANAIITEFLSLAKDKAIELKPKSLNSIILSLLPLLQANAGNQDKGIVLETEALLPDLLLDEKEIRQLILNLVNNGLESIPAGRMVKIKTFIEKDQAVLAIQDEGDGIDQGIIDKLGTPFFTTKEHGTGLGLAVSYGIAARHSARIDIKTSSCGTTFFVRFPFLIPHINNPI